MTDRELKLQGMRECLEWLESHPEIAVETIEVHGFLQDVETGERRLYEHNAIMHHPTREVINGRLYLEKRFAPNVVYWVCGPPTAETVWPKELQPVALP